jgi:hypothetical protein
MGTVLVFFLDSGRDNVSDGLLPNKEAGPLGIKPHCAFLDSINSPKLKMKTGLVLPIHQTCKSLGVILPMLPVKARRNVEKSRIEKLRVTVPALDAIFVHVNNHYLPGRRGWHA